MKDYLLEIYTEEIPAHLLNKAIKDLQYSAEKEMSKYSLSYKSILTFGTPKRLTLYVKGLSESEPDKEEEIKGPPVSVAIGQKGEHLLSFKKFALSSSVNEKDLYIKETKKGKYLFAKKVIKGKEAKNILKAFSPAVIKSLHFPKTMHWENKNTKFIRPIRSLLSLLEEEVVKFHYADVEASNITYGLRVSQLKEIEVKNPIDYFKKLKENYVILSYEDRKKHVEKDSCAIAEKVGGIPLYSDNFLEEVVNLTEYPTPFLAKIAKEGFTIPPCITESVIKDHMKSFPVVNRKGRLLPYFIGVRNGCSDFIENVRKGYEKVVRARVLDGKFFFEEDKKTSLTDLVNRLSGVVFFKGLGTLKEKTERLVRLSEYISQKIGLSTLQRKALMRSAFLSKADLLTNVVKEFPELQGEMGGIYAELQGEEKNVYETLKEQYLPSFSNDKLPKTSLGTYLSLIDKIDTLTGGFIVGIAVSGSKDPYGLRRAGNSIVQLLFSLDKNFFPIKDLIKISISAYKDKNDVQPEKLLEEIISFLKERVKGILKEKGVRYDVVNTITELSLDLAPTYLKRALTIMKHLNDKELVSIVLSNKRVSNILLKAKPTSKKINSELLFEKEESLLFTTLQSLKIKVDEKLEQTNYEEIINLFYNLSPVISKFFDRVLVMDNDKMVRNNRLALLINLKDLFSEFANFSNIVVEKDKNA